MAQITAAQDRGLRGKRATFFWKVVDAHFTIHKNKEGKVEGLLFEQGGVKVEARRVSDAFPRRWSSRNRRTSSRVLASSPLPRN